ncbi:MAG: hypothetical protein AB7T03_03335 [Bacilli bacterium]
MKCKRCGKEVSDDTKVCECGFDFLEDQKYRTLYAQKDDPTVSDKDKNLLIDFPILTFLCGLTAFLFMILFLFHPGFVVLYFGICVIFMAFTFWFAKKPTKVKLEPTRNVGSGMAYLSLAVILFKSIFLLIGLIFF